MKRYWPLIPGLLVALLLTLSPLIPFTKGWWPLDKPAEFNAFLASAMGLNFVIASVSFGILFIIESNAFRKEMQVMADRVPPNTIRGLTGREFYREFLTAAEEAQHTVRIAYFAPIPPASIQDSSRQEYYRDIASLMRSRRTVQFFRLARYSDDNRAWLLQLMRDFDGVPNVRLAMITDERNPTMAMPLALSVQVIDDRHTWVVAVEAHEQTGAARDLYVDNEIFAAMMTKYYDRLWASATVLLENGIVTEEGTQFADHCADAEGGYR